MMKYLVAFSLFVTVMTAVVLRPQTCEERGGRVESLEPVGANPPTKVCIPDFIEVTQASD